MTTMTTRRIIAMTTDEELIQKALLCSAELEKYAVPTAAIVLEQLALRYAYEIKRREGVL